VQGTVMSAEHKNNAEAKDGGKKTPNGNKRLLKIKFRNEQRNT